ncbi:hypothetical protein ABK040_013994 [Willaertia magna]
MHTTFSSSLPSLSSTKPTKEVTEIIVNQEISISNSSNLMNSSKFKESNINSEIDNYQSINVNNSLKNNNSSNNEKQDNDKLNKRENNGIVKRRNLRKNTTDILIAWFKQHINNPYPNDNEKQLLAQQTNLTMSQVSNWFVGYRTRFKRRMMVLSRFRPQ